MQTLSQKCSDLPKLLIQVRGVHQCSLLDFFIIHLLVPGDEEGAQELLHLYCDVHGDRDNEVEEDHEGQEVCEHPQHLQREEEMWLSGHRGRTAAPQGSQTASRKG